MFVVTNEAVPLEQRFVVGALEKVPPVFEPHTPFIGVGVVPEELHSVAVEPTQTGLCAVPLFFLSVTSVGRGSVLRYHNELAPAVVDFGEAISESISARDKSFEYI